MLKTETETNVKTSVSKSLWLQELNISVSEYTGRSVVWGPVHLLHHHRLHSRQLSSSVVWRHRPALLTSRMTSQMTWPVTSLRRCSLHLAHQAAVACRSCHPTPPPPHRRWRHHQLVLCSRWRRTSTVSCRLGSSRDWKSAELRLRTKGWNPAGKLYTQKHFNQSINLYLSNKTI